MFALADDSQAESSSESKLPSEFRVRKPASYFFLKPEVCGHLACVRRTRKMMGLMSIYELSVYLRDFRLEVRPLPSPEALATAPGSPPPSHLTARATLAPASSPAPSPAPTPDVPPNTLSVAPPATPPASPSASSLARSPPSHMQTPRGLKRRRTSDAASPPRSQARSTKASKRTTQTPQPQRDAKTKYDERIQKRRATMQAKNRDQRLLAREQTKELASLPPASAKTSHKKGRNKWAKKQERKRRGSESSWDDD